MEYILYLAIIACIYAILTIGLNLVAGYTGLISVAQAGFYGVGAYATAILTTEFQLNFFTALMIGALLAAVIAILFGLVLSRFRDEYYMFVTVGFNSILFGLFLNLEEVTGGPLGISGIPKPEVFGLTFLSSGKFLLLTILVLVAVYLFARWITQSAFGRALKAIREDESAIQVFGYKTTHYKLVIFVIGAAIAAAAGGLMASYFAYIDPTLFIIPTSVLILAMVILGGLANLKGSIIGAVLLFVLPEILRFLGLPSDIAGQLRQALYGVLLVLLMLYRPQGLIGEYKL